ncbi:hypothetical protein HIM_01540 [Hirsutella minnesotensis 3608]|nr:hypothetical protein HIM_01540 [Hirsutella minnesotensis 3608]
MPLEKQSSKSSGSAGSSNILSFFKPVGQPRPKTPTPAPRTSPPASTPLSAPPPSSSPRSHTPTPKKPAVSEIAASDDDDGSDGGFSDDSFEDLATLLNRGRPSATMPAKQPAQQHDPYATPRAKRIAVEFQSSPIPFKPKHKFDIKALAKDARRDDATTASSLRVKAAATKAKETAAPSSIGAPGEAFMEIVKESSGQDAQKVLRAVQRSEQGPSQQRYCFFDSDYSAPSGTPVPKVVRPGTWRLLTQGSAKVREQHLASGLLQTTVRKMKNLPDELFKWILDDLCVQKSALIRVEYCNLIIDCAEQTRRLVTSEELQKLFLRLGAHEDLKSKTPGMALLNAEQSPYQDRDWSCLRSFLWLLGTIARHLSIEAVEYALQTLLRMSMDKFLICNLDVHMEFGGAVQCLAEAVPASRWDSLCLETSTSLATAFNNFNIRANALLCLPISTVRMHGLRRRLAAAFLFSNPALAGNDLAAVVQIEDFIGLLESDEFAITLDTDFAELKSRITLLDMAIDDGSVFAFDDDDDEKRFNENIDKLASQLGDIWRKTNDSGMKLARTETKSLVELVQQRLIHAVRTRRRIKRSVFEVVGVEDPSVVRQQQDYMKRFLQKRPKPEAERQDLVVV